MSSHVPFWIRELNSWSIASRHCGSLNACVWVVGSRVVGRGCKVVVVFTKEGLKYFELALRGRLVGGGGGEGDG